jgi:hypothetical protein
MVRTCAFCLEFITEEHTMKQRYCMFVLLVAALTANVALAQYAPIKWDTTGLEYASGVNIRQGYHTEWFRAGAHDPVSGDNVYTWSDCRSGLRDVYAQKIDVNGIPQWDEGGKLICRNLGRQEDPEVIYSGDGNWIFAWVDYRNTPDVIEAGDVYAQKVNSNGDPLWNPDAVAVCVAPRIQISLRLVSDGEGGVVIIWQDLRNMNPDIFAQRITSAGQVAPGWPVDGTPVIEYLAGQENITVDTDGQGGAIVAWDDDRISAHKDIFAQRIRRDGTLVWQSAGLPICTYDHDQEFPKLCPDGEGGAYIVWSDRRDDINFGDLFFQRVDSLGNNYYQNDGRVLCDTTREQKNCRIMLADDGGAIFVWEDFRNDPNNSVSDVYAQKMSPSGAELWEHNGLGVSVAPEKQVGARFTTDGAGGTIIAWEDTRATGIDEQSDIYAQRISSAGVPLWIANGAVVCDTIGYQHSVLLKPDGSNGGFIIWADTRTGSSGLRIQHLNANGTPQLQQNGLRIHHGIDGDTEDAMMLPINDYRTLLLWRDHRFEKTCIYVQILDHHGETELEDNGVPLCRGLANGEMSEPQFVTDFQGGGLLVWKDGRISNIYNQVYAQRLDSNGNLLWTEGGVHVHPEDVEQSYPYIAGDGTGGCYVLWTQESGTSIFHVFAQRLDANGDPVWANPVEVSAGPVGGEDHCFGAAPDGEGGVITTWVGGVWPSSKVFGQKLDANGNLIWMPGGVPLYADSTAQQAGVIPDGNGGAIFTWENNELFIPKAFAQWIDRSGNYVWPDSGLRLCHAFGDQVKIQALLDSTAVWFAWEDFRDGLANRIYVQRVSYGGQLLLNPEGLFISGGPKDRLCPNLVSDGHYGVYVTWEDYADTTISDIICTHLDSTGQFPHTMWVANGNIACDALFWQHTPVAISDQDGGIILAWQDGRSSGKEQTYNLFVQRINDDLYAPVRRKSHPVPFKYSLEQNYPNPFNPNTRIRYTLSEPGFVQLAIYDILGRKVRTLNNQVQASGAHQVIWNGKTASGEFASSGVYFYKLEVNGTSQIRKMVLLK